MLPHNFNSKLDLIIKPLDQTFCRKCTLMTFLLSSINELIQFYMTVISLLKYKSNVWVDGWIDRKINRTDKIAMSVSCIKPVTISIEPLFAFVCFQELSIRSSALLNSTFCV